MFHILVIEDEETLLNLLKQILTKFGYTVDTAVDGKVGAQKLKLRRFDLVITDVRMPNFDGNSVAQYLRRTKNKNTPIIGMSGTPWDLENDNFYAVITKPFSIDTLIDKVKELLPIEKRSKVTANI
jgi:DNA-binding response OmpR family regulator